MANALWITLIGMGLVFIAILLLWGGIALLVRVTQEPEAREFVEEMEASGPVQSVAQGADTTADHKRRAAAAAVAVALALKLHKQPRREDGARQDAALSAWQAVNRASQINQAVNNPRKKVVR